MLGGAVTKAKDVEWEELQKLPEFRDHQPFWGTAMLY